MGSGLHSAVESFGPITAKWRPDPYPRMRKSPRRFLCEHEYRRRVTGRVSPRANAVWFGLVTARGKLLQQVLSGRSDQNVGFEPLCEILRWLGFRERINGSHHIFGREGIAEILNLQPFPSGKAKPYQVKQVRNVIVRYKLAGESDER